MPSVISASLMIAMVNLNSNCLFLCVRSVILVVAIYSSTAVASIAACILYRNLEFHSPAVLNLGRHTVSIPFATSAVASRRLTVQRSGTSRLNLP